MGYLAFLWCARKKIMKLIFPDHEADSLPVARILNQNKRNLCSSVCMQGIRCSRIRSVLNVIRAGGRCFSHKYVFRPEMFFTLIGQWNRFIEATYMYMHSLWPWIVWLLDWSTCKLNGFGHFLLCSVCGWFLQAQIRVRRGSLLHTKLPHLNSKVALGGFQRKCEPVLSNESDMRDFLVGFLGSFRVQNLAHCILAWNQAETEWTLWLRVSLLT